MNVFNGGGIRGKPKEFSSSFRNYISSIDSSFKGFTSNDVVFLDFSANEAFSGSHFRDKAILRDFQTGAESLIRKVYRHSTPHSFPTVIYLATAPIPYQDTELRGANEHFDHWYLELARHYNATVWSYRDAILAAIADRDTVGKSVSAKASDQCNSLGDRVDALDYLDYRHYGDTIHPSWHVHMFQSDLYASIWEHELNACNDPHIHTLVPNQDKKLSSTDNIAINLAVSNRTYAALPTELYDMSGATNEVFCDTYLQSDPLLYLSYAAIMKKEHHHSHHHTHLKPLAGSYESDPPNSWKLAEDVVGRGGFITSTIGAKIKFKFANLTYAAFQKVSAMYSVVINIEYLKTYENIGTVHVNICGRPIQQINGLWDDYQDNRVSYVQLFELDFNHEQCRVNTDSLIEVELTFKPNAPESITKGHQAHFKVISVMACFYRPDATSPF